MARVKKSAARGSRWRAMRRAAGGLALATLVAGVLAAPTLADGYVALQWTRHYAAGFGSERPQERVRQAGRWAVRAIEALAPLPAAQEAASLALQTGRQFADERPAAAQALYAEVSAALDRQRASAWRGWGLAAVAEEARGLARNATAATPLDGSRPASPSPAPVPSADATPAVSPAPRSPASPSASPGVAVSPSPAVGASPSPRPAPPAPPPPAKPKTPPAAKPKPRPGAPRP